MRLKLVSLAAIAALAAAPAWAADHVVHVGGAGLTFNPSSVSALVGDTVTFVNDGGFHNAASLPGQSISFRCADGCSTTGASGDPSGSSWTGVLTIPPAAAHTTVNYMCEVHGQQMSGSISVTDPVELQSFDID